MQGFLNLNKPPGLTSHDCVARVRRLLCTKKVGHGGTLDPAATGVLPIAVGRATRLLPYLATGKAYRAVIRFGITTTTDDLEGGAVSQMPVPHLSQPQVLAVLPQFLGQIQQVPPQYSAIQVGGRRLYDLARQGETVEVPVRQVEVQAITPLDWHGGDYPELTVAIACGPGTYIRAIARDWGQALGTGATLANLIRTHSSGFDLVDSLSLEAIAAALDADTLPLMEPGLALQHLPAIVLPPSLAKRWCQGQKIPLDQPLSSSPHYRVLDDSDRFLGIAASRALEAETETETETEGMLLVPKMVFEPLG